MAPTNIQGLNIVHPQIQTDSHDLLSGQPYPDLSAQLDLWTNLTFESDEPLNARPSPDDKYSRKSAQDEEDEEAARSPVTTEKAVHDGHINVVTGINLGNNHHDSAPRPHQASVPPPFDVTSFLAGFGIDPFSIPAAQPQPHPISPSLAQLLAYHSAAAQAHHHVPTYAHPAMPQVPAQSVELPNNSYLRNSTPAARPSSPSPSAVSEEPPAAKRARTRKASVSAAASPEGDTGANHNSASAAEDKRRRNTAASARFRLKKKEREAALESKAKELEQKVSDLERECEGLRRENGWLKGLVVGVTGAAQAPVVNPPASLMAPSSSSSKRRRDDENA
ncbi:hypothetical protein FA13DRAFT_1733693 [Coprinellus micaceus]|jgi:hypothetical protein|uniref:BZIP domain-containing protein n=1 Tax=Coprinellus micaceus TaxID=71717 RepID=A0A4Y7T8F6_COPMI|nr:hypothetical protein FA13DRAFT_1733693 [Coprinellus micaceus]